VEADGTLRIFSSKRASRHPTKICRDGIGMGGYR